MVIPIRSLKCLYSNTQSLLDEKREIDSYLEDHPVDMMVFTGNWITEKHTLKEYTFSGFQNPVVFMKNRGGASIYVRKSLSSNAVQPPEQAEDSCLIVIRNEHGANRAYGCAHRSSSSDAANNDKVLRNISW